MIFVLLLNSYPLSGHTVLKALIISPNPNYLNGTAANPTMKVPKPRMKRARTFVPTMSIVEERCSRLAQQYYLTGCLISRAVENNLNSGISVPPGRSGLPVRLRFTRSDHTWNFEFGGKTKNSYSSYRNMPNLLG